MERDTTGQTEDGARCVVLTLPDAAVGETLRALLESRGWRPAVMDDPYLAMAELCLLQRSQATRAALGLAETQRLALVVNAPGPADALDPLRELLDAVACHLPEVSTWHYTGADLLLLSPDHATARPVPLPPPATREASLELARIAVPDTPAPHITAEELAMLFDTPEAEEDPS